PAPRQGPARTRTLGHALPIFSLLRARRRAVRYVVAVANSSTIRSSSASRPIPPSTARDGQDRQDTALMPPAFTPDADWLAFDPDPSKPGYAPPAGAVDAHCPVFGPGDTFPYAPERKYTPVDAGKEQLFALRDFLGFDRNVIVQATCHGADNSALADALRAAGDRAPGVATTLPRRA